MPTVTGDNFYIDKHTLQFRTGETGVASIAYDKTDESISITNAGTGQISIGEAGGDIFIGDGSTVTDIVFEQNGSIRALANKTLTLGQSDSDVRVDGQNLIVSGDASFSGSMTINGNPVMTGASDLDTDTLQTVTDRGSTTTNHIQIDNSAGIKIERSSFDAYAQLYPAFSNVPTLMGRGAGGLHLGYESNVSGIRIDTSNNVGIGTTSPSTPLHVKGNIRAEASASTAFADLKSSQIYASSTYDIIVGTNNSLFFRTDDTRRMTILGGGNVGIGTTNPVQPLQVNGNIYSNGGHFFVDNDKSLTSVGDLRLRTNNGTTAVFIDSSQNVGIGTTSVNAGIGLQVANGGLYVTNGTARLKHVDAQYFGNGTELKLSAGQSADLKLMHYNTVDVIVKSDGKVGIGTTDPQEELDLRGDMRLDSAGNTDRSIYFRNQNSTAKVRSDAALQFDVGVSSSPSAAMYIEEDTRNVGIGTTSPTSKLHIHGGDNTGLFGSIRNDFTNRMNMKVAMGSTTRYIGTVSQYGNGDSSGFTIRIYDGAEKVFRIVRVVVQNSGGTNFPRATVEGGGEDTDIHINLEYKNRDGDATKTDFFLVPTSKSFSQYVEIEGYILRDTGWNTTSLTSVSLDTDLALNILDSVNGSRVGVGTTDPSAKLHAEGSMIVKGDATWAGTDNQNGAIFMNTAGRGLKGAFSTSYARNLILSNSNYIDLGEQSSLVYGFRFYAGSASSPVGTYDFYTSGSNSRLHIEKGGNVGIGTTNPTDFHTSARNLVVGDGVGSQGITIYAQNNAGSNLYLADGTAGDQAYRGYISYSHSAEKLSLGAGGQTRITATNAGLVGIGTLTPDTLLHLEASDPVLKIRDSSTTNNSATLWLQESDTYGVKLNYQSAGGDNGRDYLTIDTLSAADGNNQAGNHDNAWGIDQDGYVMPHKGAVDGNLLKSYEWLLYGPQVSGSTPSFPRNGTETENARIYGHNPFGEPAILWYTPNQDSSDNDDGGWNSDTFIIDRGKSYRTSVWVKKTTTNTSDGNLYLGTNYVNNLNGTYNTNPYFINGATMSSVGMENDEWYLFVGYIFDSGHTGTANHPKGGIYDRNGRKLLTAASFKFTDSGSPSDGLSSNFNKSRQRVYNYYDATTGSKTYWWGPRFEPLEASTPTLSEILNSPTSDTGASFMGSVGIGTSTHSQTNEVKLHVYKNANRATTIVQNNNHVARFEAYGTATAIDTTASNGVIIRNNSANRVHFDAGGNVGIGVDDPDTRLEVQTSVGAPMLHLRPNAASTAINPIILYRNQVDGSANYMLCQGVSTFFGTFEGGVPTDPSDMIKLQPNSSANPQLHIGDAGSSAAALNVGGNIKLLNNGASYINGGNVGIGTTNPQKHVHIRGSAPYIRIEEDSASNKRLDLYVDPSTAIAYITANQSAQQLSFQTASTDRIRITNGGNVGIGSTSPAYKLDVVDSDGGTLARFKDSDSSHAGLIIQGDTNGGSITNDTAFTSEVIYLQNSANAMRFYTDGTEAVRIDSSQRVGIGTNSVYGFTHINGRMLVESPTVPSTLAISDSGDATKALRLGYEPTWDAGSISASDFGAGWKDIVIAPYAGKVGIGTTSPHQPLSVKGTIVSYNTSYVQVAGMTNSSNAGRFYANNAGGVTKVLLDSNGDSYLNGGNVGIGLTSPTSKLDVDGLISSDQIRSKKYTSLSGSSNDWFPIGTINEHETGPVLFQVITAYHSNMSFIVAKGYAPSQEHSITLLSSIDSNNTGYASIKGVRVRQDGQVEIQLYWASGPSVIINITARSTTDPVSLPSSLATSTSTENVVDTVTNEDGKLRSRKLITTSSNVKLSDNGVSYLNGGNVGIGVTDPDTLLEVAGVIKSSSTSRVQADVLNNSANSANIIYRTDRTIVGNNASALVILDGGNVGIGTTDPQKNLDIQGQFMVRPTSSTTVGRVLIGSTASDAFLELKDASSNNQVFLNTDGDSYFDGGGVGIGVTNPDATLEVKGAGNTNATTSLHVRDSDDQKLFMVRNDGVVTVEHNYFYASASAGAYVQNGLRVRGFLENDQGTLAINGDVSFDSNTLYVDATSNRIGVGTSDVSNALDVIGTYRISDNNTNSNNKLHRMLGRHYTNAEQDVNIFSSISTSSTNAISFGGGSSSYNTATNIYFYTASNNTSTYAAGQERMRITNAGNIGIGVSSDPSSKLEVNGSFVASSKTFNIEHPTQSGKRLIHGCFEGPEHGVYFRGKTQDSGIQAPEYWSGLVDIDSMTVDVTPIGPNQSIYVDRVEDNGDVYVGANTDEPLNYFYVVYGERKDIEKLELVKDAPVASPNDHID